MSARTVEQVQRLYDRELETIRELKAEQRQIRIEIIYWTGKLWAERIYNFLMWLLTGK